ncbi:MAG: DUF1592 domain-containing protein [Polyangiales bacterium]
MGALVGCEGEIDAPPAPARELPPLQPAPAQMRRITQEQYVHLVRDLFGEDVVLPTGLEPDVRVDGLEQVGAHLATVSPRGVDQYQTAAEEIAKQAVAPERRGRWLECEPTGPVDRACAERALRSVGRRAWRRPLSREELDGLLALAEHASGVLGDFHEGMVYALSGLLQSPYFLYRIEVGAEGDDGVRRHTDWEMAERLSFFFWNRGPDDALLDAAGRGELTDPVRYAEHVDRVMADARTHEGVRAFFTDMLALDTLDELQKDSTVFEHFTADVGPAAREETLRVIDHLVFDLDADYRDLLTTRTTFLDRKLASIYGVPAPAREGFARYDFPEDSVRQGLLGHVSVLASQSHSSTTSPTLRGIFMRKVLLCGSIPPPPGDVDTSIPEPIPGSVTLRQRVARHLEDPTCAGCHRLMDPLGLGLENFDALGRWRTEENGARIDASGDVNGVTFVDAAELAHTIAASPDYTRCLTRTAYRYATGHKEEPGEAVVIQDVHSTFETEGYRVLGLLRAVALSDGFRRVGPPSAQTSIVSSEEVSP